MRLNGNIRQSKEWNDLRRWPFHIFADDNGMRLEFRLIAPETQDAMLLATAERLATWSERSEGTRAQATLDIRRRDDGWGVFLIESGFNCGLIGNVPPGVIHALGKTWETMIDEGRAVADKYDIYMAPVWQEVDQSKVMEVAELIDSDPSIDVDELIGNMKERLCEVVYHVKIGLVVPAFAEVGKVAELAGSIDA